MSTEPSTPGEMVGKAMREYVHTLYGIWPSQEDFERMYWAWEEEMERIYDDR